MQTATVRLVRPRTPCSRMDAAAAEETYRPLVVGCVPLQRPATSWGDWLVPLAPTGWVWPQAWGVAGPTRRPGRRCRTGGDCSRSLRVFPAGPAPQRLCLGLLCGADLQSVARCQPAVQLQSCVADIYGWSLLYQPQRLGGRRGGLAAVDPNPEVPELPAFYESPFELCDRLDFLDRRGVPARPLALVTRPEDFASADPQRPGPSPCRRNRFIPDGPFHRPADLSHLPGG